MCADRLHDTNYTILANHSLVGHHAITLTTVKREVVVMTVVAESNNPRRNKRVIKIGSDIWRFNSGKTPSIV